MGISILNNVLLQSLSERDVSNKYFDISVKPISESYGSIEFKNRVSNRRYNCKFVTIASKSNYPKVYVTVVMTNGKFWFGVEGNTVATKMLSCPTDEFVKNIESLQDITV